MYPFQRVFGVKDAAVLDARELNKRRKIRLFESPTSKFIVTDKEFPPHSGYREIDFTNVSMVAIRLYDKEFMSEVPDEERVGYCGA